MSKFFFNIKITTLFAFIAIFSITLISMIAHYTLELDNQIDSVNKMEIVQYSLPEKYEKETILQLKEEIRANFIKIYTLLALMVVASLIIMLIMRQKVLVPINYLLKMITKFIHDADNTPLKKIYYDDEIGQMTQEFFTMKTKLDNDMEIIRQLAEKDSLTGIYNRRTFFREANKILSTKRSKQLLILMILDIDFFKSINDTYGHIIGDKVLNHVVHLIDSKLKSIDLFARYGGEEFIVLSPQKDRDTAQALAQSIRQVVASTPYIGLNNLLHIQVTMSIGLASCDFETPLEDTIKMADEALYQAKERGRNRVVVA